MNATLLAQLRKPGHTDEDILDALRAMTCSLPTGDKTQDELDRCISRIEEAGTLAEELQAWHLDQIVKRERAESMPAWLVGSSL